MIEQKRLPRRGFFFGAAGKIVEVAFPELSDALDRLAPDTSKAVMRLRELQELDRNITNADMIDAIRGLFPLFNVIYEFDRIGPGMTELYAPYTLILGEKQMRLAHSKTRTTFGEDSEEVSIHFCPEEYTAEEVFIKFDDPEEDTFRTNLGASSKLSSLIKMTSREEDDHLELSRKQGFDEYDRRILLEAVYQGIVYGEHSTYWENTVRPMLRIDELEELNKNWLISLIGSRSILPAVTKALEEKFHLQSITDPVRKVAALDKKAKQVSRFTILRNLSKITNF